MKYDRNTILSMMHENVWSVIFTKVDGTERHMRCTLMEEYLPEHNSEDNKKVRKENPDVVAVWDLDKNAWRSFRVDSVKEIL